VSSIDPIVVNDNEDANGKYSRDGSTCDNGCESTSLTVDVSSIDLVVNDAEAIDGTCSIDGSTCDINCSLEGIA